MNEKDTEMLLSMGPTMQTKEEITRAMKFERVNFRIHLGLKKRNYCQYFSNVREVSKSIGKKVEVLLDLPSSRPRIGNYPGGQLQEGKKYLIIDSESSTDIGVIPIPGINAIKKYLTVSDIISFRDGRIKMEFCSFKEQGLVVKCIFSSIELRAMCSGVFGNSVCYEPFTEEDIEALQKIHQKGLIPDWVALSFASTREQILATKNLLSKIWSKRTIKIMAKIENIKGLQNLDQILNSVDGIMIARGDLLLHIDPVYLPLIQAHIIRECRKKNIVSVVATEVLDSLADKGICNRAELSDIALAVRQGANAIMLAHESANSIYSEECIELLNKIINVEKKKLSYKEILEEL